ncbi:uncharacterized protein LAJ45_08824 [Morchella importuna]|uniref:uncharacterized protein n=1 Tax=Morchella importuna TaxID=1174673 RepID=UPI001E8CB6A2|nr:uncharacterized protein LAJ45_08824 [Morchella importuna]KAH8147025.1 hypothetical protein LAJ45_08824 [Morchella importuna]
MKRRYEAAKRGFSGDLQQMISSPLNKVLGETVNGPVRQTTSVKGRPGPEKTNSRRSRRTGQEDKVMNVCSSRDVIDLFGEGFVIPR